MKIIQLDLPILKECNAEEFGSAAHCGKLTDNELPFAYDNPIYVICVEQEYEFLERAWWWMDIIEQRPLSGYIDCIECEEYGVPHVEYFDISRWFEKVRLF